MNEPACSNLKGCDESLTPTCIAIAANWYQRCYRESRTCKASYNQSSRHMLMYCWSWNIGMPRFASSYQLFVMRGYSLWNSWRF